MSTVPLSGSWGGPFPLLLGRPASVSFSVSFSVDDQDAFLEVAGQVLTGLVVARRPGRLCGLTARRCGSMSPALGFDAMAS